MTTAWDLIVIGGGSAGLTATRAARKLGARVLLVEKQALGGDCLWTGCVPSKTLIRTAEVAHLMRHADRHGLGAVAPTVTASAVLGRMRAVRGVIEEHDSAAGLEALGARVVIGAARFVSPTELEVEAGSVVERHRARAFLLATGSRPRWPGIDGIERVAALTSDTIWELEAWPASLIVIGAGAVGLELGQACARLGTRVTIVEAADRLLPREEPSLASELRLALEADGVALHTGVEVTAAARVDGEVRLSCTQSGAALPLAASAVLVATGRQANVEGLGLEAAGVEHDDARVRVDGELRTTNPRVFAAGDVAGRALFSHTAGLEAVVAVRNALLPLGSRADLSAAPFCVFTAPELARVGLTAAEAQAQARDVEIWEARLDECDRALTDGHERGLARLVTSGGRLVGAHLLGAHAGELIHVCALAVQERLPLRALATMSWVYPSLSEVIRKAAQKKYEALADRPTTQTALRLLRWLK